LNGSPEGDGIEASLHVDRHAIAKTDMDPGGGFLLIGNQFKKCSEMPVAGLLVLKTTPPMIEPSWIDVVFSAEGSAGQATVHLFADEALPVG
jgi:hypothetical protein